MIQALAALALSIASAPGAYVLLLGSGVSRAAGIPTGWEVVETLVARLAVAEGEQVPADPAQWYRASRGHEPSYTNLIERLAPRPAERAAILASFFEATNQERELGLKQPTRAHRAIAQMVQLGFFRVIVTTNFDRLIEAALRDVGVEPTVVSSDDDLAGIPPLTQVRCLIVKAHGDYLDTRIRNTADEVAELEPGIAAYLARVFREYGLIVAGWSAEFDEGLKAVLRGAVQAGYGAYWASRSDVGGEAAALVQDIGARAIRIRDADTFFSALLESLTSIQGLLRHGPLTEEVSVATAKRLIDSPEGRIPLSDLLGDAVERARSHVEGGRPAGLATHEEFRNWLAAIEGHTRELVRLFAALGFWGRPEHAAILVRGLDRLCRWRPEGGNTVVLQSRVYPALLALYGAGIAAVAASNYAVLSPVLRARLPHLEGRYPGDEDDLPTARVLNGPAVLDHTPMIGVLNIAADRQLNYYTPASVYLQRQLRPLLHDLIPDDAAYERAFDTFEILLAMRYVLDGGSGLPTGQYGYRGHRSMIGRGVPERLQAEMERDGVMWAPTAAGLFASQQEAVDALTGLIQRLARFRWD